MQIHACAVRNVLRQLPDSGIQFRRGERPGKTLSCHGFQSFMLGACLSISREPRWQGEGADARRAARSIVDTMDKPCNAADAPLLANPSGPGRFPLMRRCRLLIGYLPNLVGSALPEGESD